MQSDALTLYKLIILFLLNKVDFSFTNAQISDFMLKKEYTNYFNIQQALSELSDAELIHCKTIRNSSYYTITESGRETLDFFSNKISDAIKTDIMEYLKKNKYELREEVSSPADYYEAKKGEFIADCRVEERGEPIIELKLSVPSYEEAEMICSQWKSKSQEIYSYVMRTLMNRPENE